VTTTTISDAQHEVAASRIAAAGLADRVTLLKQDYRELRGTYGKLVSIEMIEAVGPQYLDAYFQACSRLLRPDGQMLLQGIVMPEHRYPAYLRSADFIQRYVFPGSALVSIGAISASLGRATRLLDQSRRGPRAPLRRHAPALARRGSWAGSTRCARSATTSGSPGCGSTTSRTARPDSPSGAPASCRCC
jgi:hypothetical protein